MDLKKDISWNSKDFHSPVCKFIHKCPWYMMLLQIN